MWKTPAMTVALTIVLSAGVAAQDAKAVVEAASRVMGVTDMTSIAFSGVAAVGNVGQSRSISFGLISTPIQHYTRAIDFTRPASAATGDLPPRSGDGRAGPPDSVAYVEFVTPEARDWRQQMHIWLTPWGFLRGAAASAATMKTRKIGDVQYRVVTWSPAQKAPSGAPYQVVGYIGPENVVDRVETWVEDPVFGDEHIEVVYTGYRAMGGLMAPARMSFRQTGMETFAVAVSQVRANPPQIADLIARGATAERPPVPPSPVAAERRADGVYRITGGYVSLAVEFHDFIVVLEGGQSEQRALAVIAETRRLFPTKRIRYVVNTHAHYDHASGLAPFIAEGVTVITEDNNKYFIEQALGTPRTLVGDALARSRKKPKVEGVIEKMVLRDGTRSLELHRVEQLEHSDGMLLAYLPREKILFTADFDPPAPGQPVSPSIGTLLQNIERLQLDFDRHVLVHDPGPDRPMTRADMAALVPSSR